MVIFTQILINIKKVIFLNLREEEQNINTNDNTEHLKKFNEKLIKISNFFPLRFY